MKKTILLILASFFIFFNAQAQEMWFDAGLKGGWGPTFLYNQNLVNNANYSQQISTGYGLGAKFGFNFGYVHGISIDAIYSQNKQYYRLKDGFSSVPDLTVEWKTIDFYVLYKMYRAINYLEIGPKFSLMQLARNNGVESTPNYVENYPSAVLGFGWYIMGRDAFNVIGGIRIEYGLSDIISPAGKDAGYPAYPVQTEAFDPYYASNPVIAQLVFEVNWGIGYFAKTACSGRRHFFKF
jgi:hypothetical protein